MSENSATGEDQPLPWVHPTAQVDQGAEVGTGTRIWHFSHIMPGARIGRDCSFGQNCFVAGGVVVGNGVKVQNNVSLYDGVQLDDFVFCGPSSVFTNVVNPRAEIPRRHEYVATRIGRGAVIGANATIVCGSTVGAYAFVGAGAVVRGDVAAYALVVGVPARQIGWMSRHGYRMAPGPDSMWVCPGSGWSYEADGTGGLQCVDWPENQPLPGTGGSD